MKNDLEKLRALVAVLRGPRGCAWDRKQTPRTLAPLLIEEAHEVVEVIERGERKKFAEEIGDLLFLILTLTHTAESQQWMTLSDVVRDTAEKYIRRHPHVFAARQNLTPDKILQNWERQKVAAGADDPFQNVPVSLPALYQAKRIYEKAERLGLLASGTRKKSGRATTAERRRIADKLLRLVRESMQHGIDPESILRGEIRAIRTHYRRFLKRRECRSPRSS